MQTPCNTPTAPQFNFELSGEAAKHNKAILSKYNFDLGRALKANKDSLLGLGKNSSRQTSSVESLACIHYGLNLRAFSNKAATGH
jgi:hypothetical protein